jgi:quinol monooxygenase YgiN
MQNQIGCECYQIKEVSQNENEFQIKSEWQNWVGLEKHLQSNLFSVLLGMLQTLCIIQQVRITDGPCEYGIELFEKLRR